VAAELDRREGSRGELCLGVTLRFPGAEDIISADITNLSAIGFLAEFPEGVAVPALLAVQLPQAGDRTAQVVWINGSMLGCSFDRPLSRSEVSAAYLKSEPRQVQIKLTRIADPTDPIWDTATEAKPHEKWSLGTRILVIGSVGTLPWLSIAGLVALFA
jgi:hypothetical protein